MTATDTDDATCVALAQLWADSYYWRASWAQRRENCRLGAVFLAAALMHVSSADLAVAVQRACDDVPPKDIARRATWAAAAGARLADRVEQLPLTEVA